MATVAGLNAQVIPVAGEQDNVTSFAKPPTGETLTRNWVEWPAVTDAVVGVAAREKSGLAMSMLTAAEVLAENLSSPAYDAVSE